MVHSQSETDVDVAAATVGEKSTYKWDTGAKGTRLFTRPDKAPVILDMPCPCHYLEILGMLCSLGGLVHFASAVVGHLPSAFWRQPSSPLGSPGFDVLRYLC